MDTYLADGLHNVLKPDKPFSWSPTDGDGSANGSRERAENGLQRRPMFVVGQLLLVTRGRLAFFGGSDRERAVHFFACPGGKGRNPNCSSSSCGVAQGIESEVGEPPQDGSMAEGRVYGLRVKKGELRVAVIAKKSGGAALADASPAPVPRKQAVATADGGNRSCTSEGASNNNTGGMESTSEALYHYPLTVSKARVEGSDGQVMTVHCASKAERRLWYIAICEALLLPLTETKGSSSSSAADGQKMGGAPGESSVVSIRDSGSKISASRRRELLTEQREEQHQHELFGASDATGGEPPIIAGVSSGVSAVMSTMNDLKKGFSERGEKLSQLGEKTQELEDASSEFERMCRELEKQQRRRWW